MSETRRPVHTRFVAAIVLSSALLVVGPVMVTRADGDRNQGAQSGGRTLEGTWRVQITLTNCITGQPLRSPFPALATFARGGTVTTADGGLSPLARGTGLGSWSRSHAGGFVAITEAFLFSPTGALAGTQRIVQAIELDHRDQEFTANVSSEILDTQGNVVGSGCANSIGRLLQ